MDYSLITSALYTAYCGIHACRPINCSELAWSKSALYSLPHCLHEIQVDRKGLNDTIEQKERMNLVISLYVPLPFSLI